MSSKATRYFFWILIIIFWSSAWAAETQEDAMQVVSAKFNGLCNDRLTDEDYDGQGDYITLEIGINVLVAGNYSAQGQFYDVTSGEEISLENYTYLNIGCQWMNLDLYGMKSSGPYRIKDLYLYDEKGNKMDAFQGDYTTKAYDVPKKELPSAELNGKFEDYGSDVNGDGIYDYLTIDVGVEVIDPGNYSLMGYLYDNIGRNVVWSLGSEEMVPGTNTIHMDFDGKTIWGHKFNGIYRLKDLRLFRGDSENENLSLEDIREDAYATRSYDFTQFVDPIWPEKIISGSGSGEMLLSILVKTVIPVFRERYSLDIVGVNMPPVSSNWTVTGSKYGYTYDLPGIHMPAKPNNFSILASGVKDLNVGVKKDPVEDGINSTRSWISARSVAKNGVATIENDQISPGRYQFKVFGEAAENSTQIDLEVRIVKKLLINGDFRLAMNMSGLPSGNYSLDARALNGSFNLDQIGLEGASL